MLADPPQTVGADGTVSPTPLTGDVGRFGAPASATAAARSHSSGLLAPVNAGSTSRVARTTAARE